MAHPRSPFLEKGRIEPLVHQSTVFQLYTALQYWSSMLSNFLVFHTSGGCVHTTLWMHHIDTDYVYREKACTGMLWATLSKSWKQHPTKQQLYGYLLPISKTIQIRWTWHVGYCWKSKDKLISNISNPSHRQAGVRWPTGTYLQLLCMDTECSLEDLQYVIDDIEEWCERVRDIWACSTTWWSWRWLL